MQETSDEAMELEDDVEEESKHEYDLGPTPRGLQASQHVHTAPTAPIPPQKKEQNSWTRIWNVEEIFEIMHSGLTMLKQDQLGKKQRATAMRTVAVLYEAIKEGLCNYP